jgi:nitroimidazol reductase NimA-like FMN-containing flavoprotein (pyridoxamine 5'-phosphate oxidase superfamily)
MRRIDRALSEEEAKAILTGGEYGILSTASNEGQPYGVPLSYSYAGASIYFHSALEGRLIDNVRENDKVSFCVVGKTQVLPEKFSTKYESVIVFGRVSEVTGDEKHTGLAALLKKYSGGFIKEGLQYIENDGGKTRVYKIAIESMTGKARK